MVSRKATLKDLPCFIRICAKDMKQEMGWNDEQVMRCIKQYIEDSEAGVYLNEDNHIIGVTLS